MGCLGSKSIQTKLSDGDTIEVKETIRYTGGGKYELTAGLRGTVFKVDDRGDAIVRWVDGRTKCLLREDFWKVSVFGKIEETTSPIPDESAAAKRTLLGSTAHEERLLKVASSEAAVAEPRARSQPPAEDEQNIPEPMVLATQNEDDKLPSLTVPSLTPAIVTKQSEDVLPSKDIPELAMPENVRSVECLQPEDEPPTKQPEDTCSTQDTNGLIRGTQDGAADDVQELHSPVGKLDPELAIPDGSVQLPSGSQDCRVDADAAATLPELKVRAAPSSLALCNRAGCLGCCSPGDTAAEAEQTH